MTNGAMPASSPRDLHFIVAATYFRPDHAGIALYSTDFADYLVGRGFRTTAVTTFPFYPSWSKRPEDRDRWFSDEKQNGMRVLRGYSYVPAKVTTAGRLLHEFTFAMFALINLVRAGRSEAIVVFAPPFLLGLSAWLWARATGARFVINIQDLPVDAAASLKMIRAGLLLRTAARLEAWIYRRADAVVTISGNMIERVRLKGVERISLVPNWIDVRAATQPVVAGSFRASHAIPTGNRLVVYAGNLGVKQGLEQFIRLAARYQQSDKVTFVIAGDGAEKNNLRSLASSVGAECLRFLPFQAHDAYRELLEDADVVYVGQRSGAGDNFFPSKLLGIMAQGKALLVAADSSSELAREVNRIGSGLVADYDDLDGIHAALDSLLTDPELVASLGAAGVKGVAGYDRSRVLDEWMSRILTGLRA